MKYRTGTVHHASGPRAAPFARSWCTIGRGHGALDERRMHSGDWVDSFYAAVKPASGGSLCIFLVWPFPVTLRFNLRKGAALKAKFTMIL